MKLYRDGLLVQSQATSESTLAQYRVGRVTFASVLDANAGYVADKEGLLLAIAERDPARDRRRGGEPRAGWRRSRRRRGAAVASVPGAGAAGGGSGGGSGSGGAAGAPAGGDSGGGSSMGM